MANETLKSNIEKVVVNTGLGRMSQQPTFEKTLLPNIREELKIITGQQPVMTKAKQSIAGFKTRAGQVIGMKVTLRQKRMEDFVKKLIHIVFPRIKDFRGIDSKNVDRNGNLTIGLREHIVFPEINPELSKADFGLEVTLVSKTKKRDTALEAYRAMGVPFKK